MSLNGIWIIVTLFFIGACTSSTQPEEKVAVNICPVDTGKDVKAFLGIDAGQKAKMDLLIKNAKKRGYEADLATYNIFNKSCVDRELIGSQQLMVTIGWGNDEMGKKVFRAFMIIPDQKGNVIKIESRYSYDGL